MKLTILPQAKGDLQDISRNIALDKPNSARKWLKEIQNKFELFLTFPEMGVAKFEVRPELRIFPYGHYLIFYSVKKHSVEIVRIIHGASDWQNLFD